MSSTPPPSTKLLTLDFPTTTAKPSKLPLCRTRVTATMLEMASNAVFITMMAVVGVQHVHSHMRLTRRVYGMTCRSILLLLHVSYILSHRTGGKMSALISCSANANSGLPNVFTRTRRKPSPKLAGGPAKNRSRKSGLCSRWRRRRPASRGN